MNVNSLGEFILCQPVTESTGVHINEYFLIKFYGALNICAYGMYSIRDA